MQIEVKGAGAGKLAFPRLMVVADQKIILLVSELEFGMAHGTVLQGNTEYPVGYHSQEWAYVDLVDFRGTIAMEN